MGDTKEKIRTLEEILNDAGISSDSEEVYKLILHNDDVNSFEWVIICLITLMKFPPDKAEKTAYTVHLMGKDIIKTGSKESLEPWKKILEDQGLSVTIEQ